MRKTISSFSAANIHQNLQDILLLVDEWMEISFEGA
jgi:hypothetical protein